MFHFRKYIRFPPKLISSLQGRQQNLKSWNKPNRQCCAVLPTWQYCRWSTRVMNVADQSSKAFVTGSSPFCDSSCKFVYGPKECEVYQFAPGTSIWRHCVSILWRILRPFPVLPFWSWSSKHGVGKLYNCSVFLLASSRYLSMHFFAWPSITYDPATVCGWGFSHPGNFSVAPVEIRGSNIFLYFSIILSFDLHSCWVHPEYTWSRNEFGSPRPTSFINFFHMGLNFCFLPAILMSSTFSDENNPCFQWTNRHSLFGTFSHPSPSRTFFKWSSHTDFVHEEPYSLQCLTKIWATCVSWKTYP